MTADEFRASIEAILWQVKHREKTVAAALRELMEIFDNESVREAT